jgi:WD40-like Beta Propeller Repeat
VCALVSVCLVLTPAAAHAAFPGQNGRIAFTRVSQNGATDLYSAEPSGIAEIRITQDGQSDNAAFSPDGTRLAYSSGDDILIADQYGNDPQLVLSTGQGVGEIDWSPDGTRLVAALTNCAEFDCEYDIYVLGVDGSGLTNLTNSIFSELNPAWSPDGSLIAFDSIVAAEEDVYTISPDGTGLANLTSDLASGGAEPDWSPDGSRIVFEGSPNSMNPDGSGKGSIASFTMPAWSPDGTRTAGGGVGQKPISGGATTLVGIGRDADWQVRPPDPVPPPRGLEFPRPKGATPVRVSLVNTIPECGVGAANMQHGPPLAYPSCLYSPNRRTSALTVGTPDSTNGFPAEAAGVVRFSTVVGNPTTPADEADVSIHVRQTDVRYHNPAAGFPDYPGELLLSVDLRVSDTFNSSPGTDGSATVVDFPLRVVVPCATTPEPVGATCAVDTTVDAVMPGLARERERTLWQLGKVVLYWEGLDGNPNTVEDNQPFATQGVFVP